MKKRDELPEEFSSYDEAGDFWDTHDSTDYLEYLTPVEMSARLETRRFEVEVDEEVILALEKRAISEHTSPAKLANDLLRKELVPD